MRLNQRQAQRLVETGLEPFVVEWQDTQNESFPIRITHSDKVMCRTIPASTFFYRDALVRRIDMLRAEAEYHFDFPCNIWKEGDEVKNLKITLPIHRE